MDDVTIRKTTRIIPNQKPWLIGEVRSLLRARDSAFSCGDSDALRGERRSLTTGIKAAKSDYAFKMQEHFISNAAFPLQGAVRFGSPKSGREGAV
jgi:hypothetical protein